jgi:hypothetical protein
MHAKQVQEHCLPSTGSNILVTAVHEGQLVGHCFVSQWMRNGDRVWWITQMIVVKGYRNQRVATRVRKAVSSPSCSSFVLSNSIPDAENHCIPHSRNERTGIQELCGSPKPQPPCRLRRPPCVRPWHRSHPIASRLGEEPHRISTRTATEPRGKMADGCFMSRGPCVQSNPRHIHTDS